MREFLSWWRSQLVPPRPTLAQLRRAAREAFAAGYALGVAAERERAAAVVDAHLTVLVGHAGHGYGEGAEEVLQIVAAAIRSPLVTDRPIAEGVIVTPDAPAFVWTGDLDDDCVCRSVPGYVCRVERAGPREWWCRVSREPHTPGDGYVFHTTDADVVPLTAEAARRLCELAVMADLYRATNPGV